MTNKAKHPIVRFLSTLLLAAIVIGLIPADIVRTASAAAGAGAIQEPSMKNIEVPGSPTGVSPPSTLIFKQKLLFHNAINESDTRYISPNMHGGVNRYSIRMSDGTNDDIRGFCIDHDRTLNPNTMIGKRWENPVDARTSSETFSSEVFRILDYYFYQLQLHDQAHKDFPTPDGCTDTNDAVIKNNASKYKEMWGRYNLNIYNALVQAMLWVGREQGEDFKPLTDDFDDAVAEFEACLEGTAEVNNGEAWLTEIRNALLYEGSEFQIPHYAYYFYSMAPGQGFVTSGAQRILIPLLSPVNSMYQVYPESVKLK